MGPDISQGRFPANLILDEKAAEMLDAESTTSVTGKRTKNFDSKPKGIVNYGGGLRLNEYTDKGGASRFFYCAKTSKKDRNSNGVVENIHPTCKPQKLMQYLCKLVTPPNGTILDPFMGSGSTGVSALSLGYSFFGIEKDKEYFEIAKKRIEHAKNKTDNN